MNLIVIRHGKTASNLKEILQGQRINESLLPEGIRDAKSIIPQLTNKNISAIYSSPLLRAYETAKIIAEKLKLPIITKDELQERDFGTLSGKTWDFVTESIDKDLKQLDKTFSYDYQPYKGENIEQVRKRLQKLLNTLTKTHKKENIACVTHGGILRLLYDELGVEQPDHITNTSIHTFQT